MKVADINVTLIDHMGSDLSVVNAARVSFAKESLLEYKFPSDYSEYEDLMRNGWRDITDDTDVGYTLTRLSEADAKLIKYLAKHKHFSPFNHAFMTFRVKAPIFVARQLVKHKFMPWNEVSRRYVDDEPEFYIPKHEWRLKADDKKQGSQEEFLDADSSVYVQSDVEQCTEKQLELYHFMLALKVCPEQARMVLPQNTMTEWIWSGSLGAFADMLRLRLDSHTQKETQEVAQKIYNIVKGLYPVSIEALLENK